MGVGEVRRGALDEATLSNLMRLSQAGDGTAYETLLTRLLSVLRAIVSRRLGATGAEDVVQEILISVHKAKDTYDPKKPFVPWLLAIAHYKVSDHWRRVARIQGREILDDETVRRAGVPDWLSLVEGDSAVELAFENLPAKQKSVVTLLKLEGFSIRQAAERLGMSEGAVKIAAHRAYKALRRMLESCRQET